MSVPSSSPAGTDTQSPVRRPITVCYFGTYRAEYSRNRILIEGLRQSGVQVEECHEPLWHGIDDRVAAAGGGWLRPAFWLRLARTYSRLLKKYGMVRHRYDILVVGYPGAFDVFLARVLSWIQGKPLVWDVFMSIYLIALERNLHRRSAATVGLLQLVERFALRLPDLLLQDTEEYVQWLCGTYGLMPARFRLVPTGADTRYFRPAADATPVEQPELRQDGHPPCRRFDVVYYGSFIPNHAVATIVLAATLLQGMAEIRFTLIGDGPDRADAEHLVRSYRLTNVLFVDWLAQEDLVVRARQADLLLGAFGTTPQSLMTVQNKIYEGLALGRPVLTGDGPAVRRAFRHGVEIYLCERNNPAALAEAILHLARRPELRSAIAEHGQRRVAASYSVERLGARYADLLASLVTRRQPATAQG